MFRLKKNQLAERKSCRKIAIVEFFLTAGLKSESLPCSLVLAISCKGQIAPGRTECGRRIVVQRKGCPSLGLLAGLWLGGAYSQYIVRTVAAPPSMIVMCGVVVLRVVVCGVVLVVSCVVLLWCCSCRVVRCVVLVVCLCVWPASFHTKIVPGGTTYGCVPARRRRCRSLGLLAWPWLGGAYL